LHLKEQEYISYLSYTFSIALRSLWACVLKNEELSCPIVASLCPILSATREREREREREKGGGREREKEA
jgi:hypothetical protein